MKHRINKKTLGRTKSHREQMWRNMAASLFENGHLTTTAAKGKELKKFVEPLLTKGLAKEKGLAWKRSVVQAMGDRKKAKTLFDLLADEKAVAAGQLRTTRLNHRKSDGAPMVKVELIHD